MFQRYDKLTLECWQQGSVVFDHSRTPVRPKVDRTATAGGNPLHRRGNVELVLTESCEKIMEISRQQWNITT